MMVNTKMKLKRSRREYKEYLLSSKWKTFRLEALNYYGHRCNKCGASEKLQLHHRTYKNLFRENFEDVEILCKPCHRTHHKKQIWKNGRKSKYMKDPYYDTKPTTYYPAKSILHD